jgi:hypothetical protein
MSAEREALKRDLTAAEKIASEGRSAIFELELFIADLRNTSGDIIAAELNLRSLRSLQKIHDDDCRRIKQEISLTT